MKRVVLALIKKYKMRIDSTPNQTRILRSATYIPLSKSAKEMPN